MSDFMKYFDMDIEYPSHVAIDILPWNTLWQYISSTFLNGLINYVKPIKIFVLGRYRGWDDECDKEGDCKLRAHIQEPPGSGNWIDFVGTKAQVFECATEPGRLYHTNLNMFGDDVLVLARPEDEFGHWASELENMYYFFWFDCDVSDCFIGRFKTVDKEEEVISSFCEYVKSKRTMGYKDEPERELPLHAWQGWVSF